MSDIGPGDVVVCVDVSPCWYWGSVSPPLVRGRAYRVVSYEGAARDPGIEIEGVPSPHSTRQWAARRFRKIDRADETFCQQVKKCRPLRTKETV